MNVIFTQAAGIGSFGIINCRTALHSNQPLRHGLTLCQGSDSLLNVYYIYEHRMKRPAVQVATHDGLPRRSRFILAVSIGLGAFLS